MTELFAGVVGGLGLFFVGMWFLTENLKALASRRLRRAASRWTGKRFPALLWGALAGGVTQSMSALTFIVVSILRSGLVKTQGALVLILGGGFGVTVLVLIVTLDIGVLAFYVLGLSAMVVVAGKPARYRHLAASFLGGAMIIIGLVLLRDAAAPLAEQPWFRDMLEASGNSLAAAFLTAVFLTCVVRSASVVAVFGIILAGAGILSADQAIMAMYGSVLGSGVIVYLLSAGLTGRSRQVAMYLVGYSILVCAVLVPLLYCEILFDIPLVKALVLSVDLDLEQQLALVYVLAGVILVPVMLAGLDWSVRMLESMWPADQADELSRPRFIHGHASVDVDTSLVLVDLEQRRLMKSLSLYFNAVREGGSVGPLRESSRKLLTDVGGFLDDLQASHPMQGVEHRDAMRSRQKLLGWLENALGDLGETLAGIGTRSALAQFKEVTCESVDGVLLSMIEAMETNDEATWEIAKQLTGDRGQMMRDFRVQYLEMDPPLENLEEIDILLITNSVEEVFFLLSKVEKEFNPAFREEHVPHA